MRSDRTASADESREQISIGVLTLLAFTFVAGYLLGQRRTEQSWQAMDDPEDHVTVEVDEDTSIPGESLVGDNSEPGKEVSNASEIRSTPDPEDGNESSGVESGTATDDGGTAPPEMEAQTPEAETMAEAGEGSGESAGAEGEETEEEATEDSETDDGHDEDDES